MLSAKRILMSPINTYIQYFDVVGTEFAGGSNVCC